MLDQIWEVLRGISVVWTYELFSLDGQPMSVGKIITGIILLVLGYRFSRRASEAIDNRFINRLDVDLSTRYTLRRVLFFFLFAVVTLSILRALHFPITVFTVIGGALAIGFGFGSQNLVSNFISGVIMMVERPVRVGDFIEVDGNKGTVEIIGIRATHLLTAENREVIIPNSFFLEKAVTNWTLGDDIIRYDLNVGVAYGSDLNLVRQVLLSCCQENPFILKHQEPKVLLVDFGDNAIIFRVLFFSRHGGEKVPVEVSSELRFSIDAAFRKHKISMPFPQRDVHLDVARPLPVEWVNAKDIPSRPG